MQCITSFHVVRKVFRRNNNSKERGDLTSAKNTRENRRALKDSRRVSANIVLHQILFVRPQKIPQHDDGTIEKVLCPFVLVASASDDIKPLISSSASFDSPPTVLRLEGGRGAFVTVAKAVPIGM